MGAIHVGVYWGPRHETVLQCAGRLERHFAALINSSDRFTHWYEQSGSTPASVIAADVQSVEALKVLLECGVNRRDDNQQIIPELGYRIGLWNANAGGWSASTTIGCGMYWETDKISNVALVTVHFDSRDKFPPGGTVGLLKRLIEVWEPDSGKVWQSFLWPNAEVENAEWRELVYADYRALSLTTNADPQQFEFCEEFAGGQIRIDAAKAQFFENE